jgi:hypothetical protein
MLLAALMLLPTTAGLAELGPASTAAPPPAGQPGADVVGNNICVNGVDVPELLDECGDTMQGDLAFAAARGVQFPAGRLVGDNALMFNGQGVCIANLANPGCAGSGDISGVLAGSGLSGGGLSGDVTLSVNFAATQARVTGTCAAGSYVRSIAQDGSVVCGADANSGGTVTSVGSGAGLAGGPITTAGTLSIANGGVAASMLADGAVTAAKLGEPCSAGQVLKKGSSAWACGADQDTTYSAASGLSLSGTTFGLSASGCSAGYVWKWGGSAWSCSADLDTNSGGTVTSVGSGAGLAGGPITGSGTLSIATGGVTSAMLLDGAIATADLANGAVTGAKTDATTVQARVTGACAAGNYVRAVAQDGTVTCGADQGTAYTGTAPVSVSGSTISLGGCAANQVLKWNGTAWNCADVTGGTVTSLTAGSGLTGGTITTSGTIAVDTASIQRRVTGACAAGSSIRVVNQDGTVACQDAGTGDITGVSVTAGSGLTGGGDAGDVSLSVDRDILQLRVTGDCAAGSAIRHVYSDGLVDCESVGVGTAWLLGGNGGTTPGTNFLGTTDSQALELKVNGARALRVEPASTPNLVGGFADNSAASGVLGAFVGGGGSDTVPNAVSNNFGAVGGGAANHAGDASGVTGHGSYAFVGGGYSNTASGDMATVGGGWSGTASADYATVAGGVSNTASGSASAVGGGRSNSASGASASVAGGDSNTAGGAYAAVGGGASGHADQDYAVVAGGDGNSAGAAHATVGGGQNNRASGQNATVAGGFSNTASGAQASVAGGTANTASGSEATVAGGAANTAGGFRAFLGAGSGNAASGAWAALAGGYGNTASGEDAAVGGGELNTATALDSTVGGGDDNDATASYATVGGGITNAASVYAATVAGGERNTANGSRAAVGGGQGNVASSLNAVVAGGNGNTASGLNAAVLGGSSNTASGSNAAVGGGSSNTASGSNAAVGGGSSNTASGSNAAVGGGSSNTASGEYSFAAGHNAVASHRGAFVWADDDGTAYASAGDNEFAVRASKMHFNVQTAFGGHEFVVRDGHTASEVCYFPLASTTGAVLTCGGVWADASDRALKDNFAAVDSADVLARVVALPITEWNYKLEGPWARHIGPTAQDWWATFHLGNDDKGIAAMDKAGVALVAIQELVKEGQRKDARITGLEAQLEAQQHAAAGLEARLAHVEALLAALPGSEAGAAAP